MMTHMRGGGRLLPMVSALVLSFWGLSQSSIQAQPPGPIPVPPVQNDQTPIKQLRFHKPKTAGTLGYGAPGLYPGFQGFGLGFHLGYGYGGDALGPGADGGYPYYGGPGYPHAWPCLRRIGGIMPFNYYGGPGHPTPTQPNFYGAYGPLAPDQPVVTVATEPGNMVGSTDYGTFTGAVPNAEGQFAQFTARAAAGATSMRMRPRTPLPPPMPPTQPTTPVGPRP